MKLFFFLAMLLSSSFAFLMHSVMYVHRYVVMGRTETCHHPRADSYSRSRQEIAQ